MTTRPLVSVYGTDGKKVNTLPMPAVLSAPIRADVVHFVHTSMAKNKRQAYAVSINAGEQTSAQSWGTGRAVARIPRVGGGGTHRSGEGAFGNMCRGGRMYSSTKIWRRWHRKINLNQRRMAVASALAASSVVPLVMARGHRVDEVPEIPLVISNDLQNFSKTKAAVELLATLGAYEDVERVKNTRKLRPGKGKIRNRRYALRRGPLVIFKEDNGVVRAFRNLPGVDLCNVDKLNLLQLAPGGHLGRFCIWSADAFASLDELFGTETKPSSAKSGYKLTKPIMANPDLARIINSDEIQSKLRDKIQIKRTPRLKKNPLKNLGVMLKLNPHALTVRRAQLKHDLLKKLGKVKKSTRTPVNAAVRREQKKKMAETLLAKQDA